MNLFSLDNEVKGMEKTNAKLPEKDLPTATILNRTIKILLNRFSKMMDRRQEDPNSYFDVTNFNGLKPAILATLVKLDPRLLHQLNPQIRESIVRANKGLFKEEQSPKECLPIARFYNQC